jgi:hypothetical protein
MKQCHSSLLYDQRYLVAILPRSNGFDPRPKAFLTKVASTTLIEDRGFILRKINKVLIHI